MIIIIMLNNKDGFYTVLPALIIKHCYSTEQRFLIWYFPWELPHSFTGHRKH